MTGRNISFSTEVGQTLMECILFRLQHIPVTSFLSPSCCPLAGTCFISYRLFFCRYIHLVTACRIIRFRHFQHPCGKHRIDIDIHHVFSGFEVQILHYIKQRFRLDAELQNLLFLKSCLLGFLRLFSWVVFLGRFLGLFSWVVFLLVFPPSCMVSTT